MKREKAWPRPWTPRPRFDGFVLAAAVAAIPGMVVLVAYANRPSPLHLIPVVAGLVPLTARTWDTAFMTRTLSAGLFGVFVLLGAASGVGLLFVPSAGLAVAGAIAATRC